MGRNIALLIEEQARILTFKESGKKVFEISKLVNRSRGTVYNVLKHGRVRNATKKGPTPQLSPLANMYLVQKARMDRYTVRELHHSFVPDLFLRCVHRAFPKHLICTTCKPVWRLFSRRGNEKRAS